MVSPVFFKTLVVWSSRGLIPRPPSRHTDALLAELTGRHGVAEQACSIFSPWNLPHFRPVCNSIVGYSPSQSYRDGTRSPKTNIPICLSLFDSISMLKWRELHVCDLTVLTDCRTNLFLDHIPWLYEWNQSFKVWLAAAREFSEFCFLLDG